MCRSMQGSIGDDRMRGQVDGDGDDGGTLGGIKRLKRTVKVVQQACRSMWSRCCLELVPRTAERCLMPKCWKFVVGVLQRGVV
jgi:hypothetical protein